MEILDPFVALLLESRLRLDAALPLGLMLHGLPLNDWSDQTWHSSTTLVLAKAILCCLPRSVASYKPCLQGLRQALLT